jgi:hypothetical protein
MAFDIRQIFNSISRGGQKVQSEGTRPKDAPGKATRYLDTSALFGGSDEPLVGANPSSYDFDAALNPLGPSGMPSGVVSDFEPMVSEYELFGSQSVGPRELPSIRNASRYNAQNRR